MKVSLSKNFPLAGFLFPYLSLVTWYSPSLSPPADTILPSPDWKLPLQLWDCAGEQAALILCPRAVFSHLPEHKMTWGFMPHTRNPGVGSNVGLISWLASARSRGHQLSPSAKVPWSGRAGFSWDSHLALLPTPASHRL